MRYVDFQLFYLGSCLAMSTLLSACSNNHGLTSAAVKEGSATASDAKNNRAPKNQSNSETTGSRMEQLFASKNKALTEKVFGAPVATVFDRQHLSKLPARVEVLGVTLEGLDQWKDVIESQIEEITTSYATYGDYLASRKLSAFPDLSADQLKENLLVIKELISRGPDALKQYEKGQSSGLYLGDIGKCVKDIGQTIWGAINGTVGCIAPEISVAGAAISVASTGASVVQDTLNAPKGSEAMGQPVPYPAAVATQVSEAVPCVGGWIGMADHGMQAGRDCKHMKIPEGHDVGCHNPFTDPGCQVGF